MVDAEKVVMGLEKIYESYVDSEIIERHDYGDTRTADIFKQNASIIHDALELLKAYEPVEPVYNGDCDWEECPNCGYVLSKRYNPCPGCGRPVKWND